MTPTEAVQLVAYIALRCPGQRIEDGTPDAWYKDLQHIDFGVAREAARRVTARQPFVALSEILAEVRVLRQERREWALLERPALSGPREVDPEVNARGLALVRAALAEAKVKHVED